MSEEIIKLEDGYGKVYKDGIQPFLQFIEGQDDKDFFKAKEFVKHYDMVYNMCNQREPYNWSQQLYDKYTDVLKHYLNTMAKPRLDDARKGYEMGLLKEWRLRWNKYKIVLKGLASVFMYLDRFFCKEKEGVLGLREQGYKVYKELVFDAYAPIARQVIIAAINRERGGEDQDRDLLKDAVSVWQEMGQNFNNLKLTLYKNDLEKQIIADAGTYYRGKSRSWVDEDSCPVYLEKCEKMLYLEQKRVEAYLHRQTTLEPLLSECYNQLLKAHQREILEKKTGIANLLATDSRVDLTRLYSLYRRVPEDLVPIAEHFEKFVSKAGTKLVDQAKPTKAPEKKEKDGKGEKKEGDEKDGKEEGKDEKKDDKKESKAAAAVTGMQLVQNLVSLHDRFSLIVNHCFDKALVFQKALKNAFTDFINADTRVSKLLALFCHDLLQKGSKFKVEDLEGTLEHVVFLYGYIREKDIFEHDYQKYLARRLLEGTSRSEHHEKYLIGKLKVECGYQWVGRLEGMFKDVQISVDYNNKFRSVHESKSLDLYVMVCSKGYWPAAQNLQKAKMPQQLQPATEAFNKFYKDQQAMRKIDWMFDLGQAEVNVRFAPGYVRTLQVSTFQMMCLLVFNSSTKAITCKQILDMTGLPKHLVADHLVTLAHPTVAILLKRPDGKELEDSNMFIVNPKYKNPLRKVVVPVINGLVPAVARQEGPDPLVLARRNMIDCAIVRIMKVRQTLKHAQLTAEVMAQLKNRFDPKSSDIKKRIDALIEQADPYLRRDESDRALYHYVS